jgi:methoxymalonate biosynthesis acyl carrier protein
MAIHENGGIKEEIRGFITRSIQIPQLADDDDLFATGIVNSLFAVQLVTFIEKRFALEVEAEDLEIRNFRSLNAAADFVRRKTQNA